MRALLSTKLGYVLKWLKRWIISHKMVLNIREAALYLNTDVVTIDRLTRCYFLPFHKTHKLPIIRIKTNFTNYASNETYYAD